MITTLDIFYCLNATSDDYESIETIVQDVTNATKVRVSAAEIEHIVEFLCEKGFLRKFSYNVENRQFVEAEFISGANEKAWFLITPEGQHELDRIYIEDE
jgi:hypothetical protein